MACIHELNKRRAQTCRGKPVAVFNISTWACFTHITIKLSETLLLEPQLKLVTLQNRLTESNQLAWKVWKEKETVSLKCLVVLTFSEKNTDFSNLLLSIYRKHLENT